ncbi:galectin-9 isoform X2 [Alligator mississippiensis]|uniref:galectin-9 isoform X2 n=1 Tax=Alligator mississippiensis TaxID=8496 RepID=UPI0028773B3F|nr:galectin-9 isoform X2 [Alligator mississippiensis]
MALQQPIMNPTIPFSGPIFGGLVEGKMLLIQGQVGSQGKRFAVNLRCANNDIAFHFNPRFDESRPVVVCNTEQGRHWGPEERTYIMPFQHGTYFEMITKVQGHCYQVAVNGQQFLEYRHRVPFLSVQILEISGDVTVNCISFTGALVTPACAPPPYGMVPGSASGVIFHQMFGPPAPGRKKGKHCLGWAPAATVQHPAWPQPPCHRKGPVTVSNPNVPFQAALLRGPHTPLKITIVGNVPSNANRFHVNLKNALTGNTALHINPRLREGALVRNTQTSGSWGSEERHVSTMPFAAGQAFQMEIKSTATCYRVMVNGRHAFDYNYRIPDNQVDQMEVDGDVGLSYVQY